MVKVRVVECDVRTGKVREFERDVDLPPAVVDDMEENKIDLRDVKKLIKYAKEQGWI